MKQPVVKKGQGLVKRPGIAAIRASVGLSDIKCGSELATSCAEKPLSFIPMGEAFQEALKLPGIPEGYTTLVSGWSNTGKSTLKNTLIASCQEKGILPVIFETEGNFDFNYAINCGMQATPVYGKLMKEFVDTETGEIVAKEVDGIVDYTGEFLFYDHKILAKVYGNFDYSTGKETKTARSLAVIEDIAKCMGDILDKQESGEIPMPICFIWDSIGSISSFKSVKSNTGNNMFDAGALSAAFNMVLNNRIPSSRKVDSPYTNTFFCVNKIWNDSQNAVGGAASIEMKGGKTFYYGSRLILHVGGIAKAGTKKLTATAGGQNYNYGIETRIRVMKNQLPAPYNLTYEGGLCCVHNGLISPDKLDEYKKTYAKDLLKELEKIGDTPINDALTFSESYEAEPTSSYIDSNMDVFGN